MLKELVVVAVTIGLTYFVTIKVKFAKTENQAMAHAALFILCLLWLSGVVFIAWRLLQEFLSPEPLDRMSLLLILAYSFTLFNSFVFLQLIPIMKMISSMVKLQGDIVKNASSQLDLVKKTIRSTDDQPKSEK